MDRCYEYLFAGTGLSNLIFGLYLLRERKVPASDILMIEKTDKPGGLYWPWDSSKLGEVDKGMHLYYETGIEDIDTIVYEILTEDNWILHEGNRKDIAGAIFNGCLQKTTPYPDLRSFPPNKKAKFLYEVLDNMEIMLNRQEERKNDDSCQEYWQRRFGDTLTEEVLDPICKKLYGESASCLKKSAAYLTKLDRVVLFDEKMMEEIGASSEIRNVIAYPDQLNMPNYRSWNQRAYYPNGGLKRLINALVQALLSEGINILKDSKINSIHYDASSKNVCVGIEESRQLYKSKKIVWGGGASELKKFVTNKRKLHVNPQECQAGKSAFVYHRLDKEAWNFGELYYAYSYDSNNSIFRLTNLSSYSRPTKNTDKDVTFCVEYHFSENDLREQPVNIKDREELIMYSKSELVGLNILDNTYTRNIESDSLVLPSRVFPIPILNDSDSEPVSSSFENWLIYAGKGEREPPFFLVDILRSLYKQF